MIAASLPGNGKRLDGTAQSSQRFQVFHPQDIVGGQKQRRVLGIFTFTGKIGGQRLLPGRREGLARPQPDLQRFPVVLRLIQENPRQFLQGPDIAALAAERQHIHAAKSVQQFYPGPGEKFRALTGVGRRQGKDQIRAAKKRQARPGVSVKKSGSPPLHKGSADDRHDDVRAGLFPRLFDLIGMSPVKGIVFRNNSRNFHKSISSEFIPILAGKRKDDNFGMYAIKYC